MSCDEPHTSIVTSLTKQEALDSSLIIESARLMLPCTHIARSPTLLPDTAALHTSPSHVIGNAVFAYVIQHASRLDSMSYDNRRT